MDSGSAVAHAAEIAEGRMEGVVAAALEEVEGRGTAACRAADHRSDGVAHESRHDNGESAE